MSSLLIIAGEASADLYAAQIARDLKSIDPEVKIFGVGGANLENAGAEIIVRSSQISVMGFSDWLGRAGEVIGAYRKVVKTIRSRTPDAALLIDLPDFNLRIASHLHEMGVPVVYFISPQLWAWRAHRIKEIKRVVNKMLVIFPFEEKFYAENGVPAEFVGHPLLEHVSSRYSHRGAEEVTSAPRLAVLPGSRPSELSLHLPVVSRICRELKQSFPKIELTMPVASTVSDHKALKGYADVGCRLVQETAESVLKWADLGLVASGTATLEAALVGTPLVAFYRVTRITEAIFRLVTPYRDFIALPNVIMKRQICPEFIQKNCRADRILPAVKHLLTDSALRGGQAAALKLLRQHLESTQPGTRPSQVVATRVNAFLKEKNFLDGRRLLIEPTLA